MAAATAPPGTSSESLILVAEETALPPTVPVGPQVQPQAAHWLRYAGPAPAVTGHTLTPRIPPAAPETRQPSALAKDGPAVKACHSNPGWKRKEAARKYAAPTATP